MKRPHVRSVADSLDRDSWLLAREDYITASDVATICGKNKYGNKQTVLHEKLYGREQFNNEHTIRGNVLENLIIAEWPQRFDSFNLHANTKLYVNSKYPWLAATPDAFTHGLAVVDIKAPNNPWTDGLPEAYVWQVHAQMLACDCTSAYIVAGYYLGETLEIEAFPVDFDGIMGDTILTETKKFYDTWQELK